MRFASLFVQVLNVILLTADEASELCSQLRSCFPAEKQAGKALFDQLFPAWSLNPFSAVALCWLAENYAVAYAITQSLATQEPSMAMLLQAEKLVQLFESPVFVHVRLQLINAGSPSLEPLLQSLYGLMMILPQSEAYHLLQSRLTGITPLHVIMHSCEATEWAEGCAVRRRMSEDNKKRVELYQSVNRPVVVEWSVC